MASSIIATNPVTGSPTTASVRANFTAAKNEIEALQAADTTLQSNIDLKAPIAGPTFTGTATIPTAAITSLTFNGVAITASGAEINYLDGVTSNIQTQLDGKQASGSYLTGNQTITLSGDATGSGTTSIAVTVDMSGLSGTTYAAGSGANITALNASNISSGTISDARLPATISSNITGSSASCTGNAATATNASAVDGKSVSVVASLPGSPDANTIYFVTT